MRSSRSRTVWWRISSGSRSTWTRTTTGSTGDSHGNRETTGSSSPRKSRRATSRARLPSPRRAHVERADPPVRPREPVEIASRGIEIEPQDDRHQGDVFANALLGGGQELEPSGGVERPVGKLDQAIQLRAAVAEV